MNRNSRYRARHNRRNLYIRRAIFAAIVLALLAGLIVLIVHLASGSKEDPAKPQITLSTTAPTPEATDEPTQEPTTEPVTTDEPVATQTAAAAPAVQQQPSAAGGRSAHIRVLGDVMFHQEQLDMAKQPDGSYDFGIQFKYIADSIGAADYTIANLETTVGKYKDMKYSGYPQFNAPESVLPLLKDCGIDFFTLANNHMLDRWFDGLKNNVALMEKYGFDYVGAYRSQAERDTPTIYEINGIKVGFLAYTQSTNTMERTSDPAVKEYGVPYYSKSAVQKDVAALKEAGAECIIALPHCGEEYKETPDDYQESVFKTLAAAGVDIILGNHPHVVQSMGTVTGTDENGEYREVFYIWSIGNFISAMTKEGTDCGIILDFTIEELDNGRFVARDIGYVPIYVWKHGGLLTVLPIGSYSGSNRPDVMTDDEYNKMVARYNLIVETLGDTEYDVLAK
ncbi:MAG: CapA family protein [Clostridia bacterium]|nr:CapA family protein [Clostridia bacterium]